MNQDGSKIIDTGAGPAVPASCVLLREDADRVVSDVEAEIHALAQQLHDKIVALAGDTWIGSLSSDLREARNSVEAAAEWVREHFAKHPA